jgi:hypothetical protein
MTHHAAEHRTQAMNECIDNCTLCHAICLETINYCLGKGDMHGLFEDIALLATCADICATSASTMLRGAAIHPVICAACAEVCRQCVDACAQVGDDAQMQRCAEACRRCAESCAAMARQ